MTRRRIGVEVRDGEVLAAWVARRGGRVHIHRTVRVPLAGPGMLNDALAEVSAALAPGGAARVAVAPPPGDVWLKLISLPPLPAADRVRMLEMEADRYFPVQGEPVLVEVPAEGPVAAGRGGAVEAIVARVEEALGSVSAVEPAPRAALRAWAALDPTLRRGVYVLVSRSGAWWDVSVGRGATILRHARLLPAGPDEIAGAVAAALGESAPTPRILLAAEEQSQDVEGVRGALEARFAGAAIEGLSELASGVAVAFDGAVGLALSPAGGLLPHEYRTRLRGRARRRSAGWMAAAAVSAALFFAVGPWSRTQDAAALDAEAALLAARADTATALLERTRGSLDAVRFTDSLTAARSDWLGTLAELTQRLPSGAYVTHFRGQVEEGVVEVRGYAGRASAILPLLEESSRFHAVEATEPVTRRTVGGVELENFTLRMRVVP